MAKVKIRFRQVISRGNQYGQQYGRYDEYQVAEGRKVIFRGDTLDQAKEWVCENGHEIINLTSGMRS
jgi:hypothetical protein